MDLETNQEVPNERTADVKEPLDAEGRSGDKDLASEHRAEINMDTGSEITADLADVMSRMEPTRAEVVRAARAFQALRRLGAPLRGVKGDYFSMSQPAHKMQFWSHSWHGSSWAKVITLFFIQNSTPAAVLSTLLAFCVALFLVVSPVSSLEDLVSTLSIFEVPGCFVTALVAYGLVLLLWRRQNLVFVDKLCISDSDQKLKVEGLVSMGAILKSSDSMLVLWDKSYQKRLWCLFEIAAFLRSRPGEGRLNLIIRPTLMGPLLAASSLAMILASGGAYISMYFAGGPHHESEVLQLPFWLTLGAIVAVVFFGIADATREYFREIESLWEHLRDFRFDDALCYCCHCGHVDPATGGPLLCDRAIVRKCITNWFGCVDEFERTVRTEVLDILVCQLSAAMVSYRTIIEASTCLLWLFFDFAAALMPSSIDLGLWILLRGFAYWLGVIPTVSLSMYKMAHCFRRTRRSRCLDKLVSLLLVFFGVCLLLVFAVWDETLYWLLHAWLPEPAVGAIFWASALSVAALAWSRPCFPTRCESAPRCQHSLDDGGAF